MQEQKGREDGKEQKGISSHKPVHFESTKVGKLPSDLPMAIRLLEIVLDRQLMTIENKKVALEGAT
jgi:hypothetical protein